ncbi:MAG: glycosyltransferase family 4 protein [Pyrinomonadaceae bacterium]|nr:glycosyltransferase family 4 protein [Pyrinomonadaceae bacterium]
MRIGVDACCWSNRRGFGRFTRELLEAMLAIDKKNEYLFFVDKDTAAGDGMPETVRTIVAPTLVSPTEAASAEGRRSLRDVWALSRQVMKHRLDLFFFPAVYSYFPIFNRTKIVVTIHDVIADHHPDLVFPNRKLKLFWKLKQNVAIRQADLILTVSENAKQQIIEYFRLPESRVRAISEAARPVFVVLPQDKEMVSVLRRYSLDSGKRFLLYVGGISPHKNLQALVGAFHQLISDSRFADVRLMLVGDYKDDSFFSAYWPLKNYIDQLHLDERVIFTGFIADKDLAYLYNAAALMVLPSLEEGFGLPAIEAMACGTPVVSSDRGSLPEVLGEAGRFFDPLDTRMMADTLKRVLSESDLRKEMREAGLSRAQQFTWNKAAKDTLSIFNELMKR